MRIRPMLAASLTLALVGPCLAAPTYRDVPRQHWAFEEVHWIREREIIPEVSPVEFQGDRTMDRYEAAATLTNYMKNYYQKRDSIDSEIQDLHQADSEHRTELKVLQTRSQNVGERLQKFLEFSQLEAVPAQGQVPTARAALPPRTFNPPAPVTPPQAAPSPRQPPAPTAGLSFRERLERLRAKVKADQEAPMAPPAPADPTGVPPPAVTPQEAETIWNSF